MMGNWLPAPVGAVLDQMAVASDTKGSKCDLGSTQGSKAERLEANGLAHYDRFFP